MSKITSTIANAIMIAFAVAGCTPTGATSVPSVSPSQTVTTPEPTEVTPTMSPTASPTAKPSSTPTMEPTTEPSPTASPTVEPTISATEEPEPTEKPEPVRKWKKPVECRKSDIPYWNVAACKVKGHSQEEIFRACIRSGDWLLADATKGKYGYIAKGYTSDDWYNDTLLCGDGSGLDPAVVYGIPDTKSKSKRSAWIIVDGFWRDESQMTFPFKVSNGLTVDSSDDNVVSLIDKFYTGGGD